MFYVGLSRGKMKKIYSVAEVAKILEVRENTVYTWIRLNKIKTIPFGVGDDRPRVRITESELQKLPAWKHLDK
jgi:excisionase family DNA binding protein